jgi:5-methyltetrahydrofolate--homocysteine methyltransferase
VGADTFVRVAKERKADIVAMSSLLTTTMLHSKTVVEALREEGLKGKVKVLLGGAPVTRSYADEIEAEGYADDCVTAVDEANRLMENK